MWVSEKWSDYELIDVSAGERLERWGKVIIARPDPQAIWKTPKTHGGWIETDARYIRSSTGGGKWHNKNTPDKWRIKYRNLTFGVSLMNFKHTGLFPEQASNWDFIEGKIKNAGREISVLNLFAYTGASTLSAAAAGAKVCHVDAARGMVLRAKDNAELSGLAEKPIRWIVDDCIKFIRREIKRGNRYDAIIMDPPAYGRGPSGEVWRLEDDLYGFVELCLGVLSDNPLFALINTYTTGLSSGSMTYIAQSTIGARFGGQAESRELGLPVTQSGLILPCGASCRWEM